MYDKNDFIRGVKNPGLAIEEIEERLGPVVHYPRKVWFKRKYGSGIDIMSKDWDFLIILDACRYDAFKRTVELNGELKEVISRGSHSIEFCEKNFSGKRYYDTVYITANGYCAQSTQQVFHDHIFTDQSDAVPNVDVLHSTLEGIVPSTVYNTAMDAYDEYERKRLIIHFMQPHDPYLGSMAGELRDQLEDDGIRVISRDSEKIKQYHKSDDHVVSTLAEAAKEGHITKAELKSVYYENLELVMEYVGRLVDHLDGKIVITADHGELLGEHDTIGHPKNRYFGQLRKVPWFSIESNTRPAISKDPPSTVNEVDTDIVEERLTTLGYK
jgi:hypothetical protein